MLCHISRDLTGVFMDVKCCYCKNNSFIKAQDTLFKDSFECNHCGKTNHIYDMLLLKFF